MSDSLYLAEITAWDPNTQATRVLRYSTGAGFVTAPNENPPNAYFEPRIAQPVSVSRSMFAHGATQGRSRVVPGDLVLLNGDGELDFILRRPLDGRQVAIYRTTARNPAFPSDFRIVFVGTMNQPEVSADRIRIALTDRQRDVNVPLQPTKYAGTNALPSGLEGTADDLKGKPKPVCFGIAKNIDPPLVNTSRLIYQVNDGEIDDVTDVYDRGIALTQGSDYTSQSDMETNAPSAGNYRVWPAGGYFRLGSTPDGLVTADVVQGASAADRTAARIFDALIRRVADVNPFADPLGQISFVTDDGDTIETDGTVSMVASETISQADLDALDAANPAELGYWTHEEVTIDHVCDLVAGSVGAWWGVDQEGVFRIQQFAPPALADSVYTITVNDLLRPLERLATNDPGGGIPVYRQVVQWGRFYATQSTDIAGAVTAARREQIREEWREVVAEDTDIQQAHLLSPEWRRSTLLTTAADATTEAARLLEVYKLRRDRFEVVIPLTAETDAIDLGDVVSIRHSRYGLMVLGSEDGMPFLVLGVEPDAARGQVTLSLWGSSTGLENLVTDEGVPFVTDDGAYLTSQAA